MKMKLENIVFGPLYSRIYMQATKILALATFIMVKVHEEHSKLFLVSFIFRWSKYLQYCIHHCLPKAGRTYVGWIVCLLQLMSPRFIIILDVCRISHVSLGFFFGNRLFLEMIILNFLCLSQAKQWYYPKRNHVDKHQVWSRVRNSVSRDLKTVQYRTGIWY